ncbi:MAG: dienelactone hydrolase family protein [Arenimonas sp.]
MNTFLETHEIETGALPSISIIWLHGLGADGFDFAPIVPELIRTQWPAIRFVFPHAPVRAVTINNGARMRAWYDIKSFDFKQRADEAGVRESMQHVDALIARENDRGVPASRIFLVGFSQGGAVALAAGLRREAGLAGIVALSTYLPMADTTATEITAAGKNTPVFFAHGSGDPVIPMAIGHASHHALTQFGVNSQWHDYPMQHGVCAEEISDLAAWLNQHISVM